MTSEEKNLQAQLAALGLPDDLEEIALKDAPALSPDALDRIRQRTLRLVTDPAAAPIPVQKEPRRLAVWAAAAALALVAVGTTAVVGPRQVWATMMSYVPGFGTRDPGTVIMAAAHPVRIEQNGDWVEVRGLMADPQGISVQLASRGEPISFTNVFLDTGNGGLVALDGGHYSTAGGLSFDGWLWAQGRALDPGLKRVTVVISSAREWRIPLDLVPGSSLKTVDHFGPSATAGGYRVAARLTHHGDRTDLTILAAGVPAGTQVTSLGRYFPDMAIHRPVTLTAPGWEHELRNQGGTLDELWHYEAGKLPAGVGSVRLTVPVLEAREKGQVKVRLPVATGTVDQTFQFGNWPLRIIRTEVVPAGLKVFVDPGPTGPKYLWGFGRAEQNGRPLSMGLKVSDTTGQIEFFQIPVEPGVKSVTVTLRDPEIIIQGPWVIDLPVNP